MKYLIGILCIPYLLIANENAKDWKAKTYISQEYLETRFVDRPNASRTNILQEFRYKEELAVSGELRGEKKLASAYYKNNYFYASAGHRYKPLQGFYILRDERFYSAFQNPNHGIVPQPILESYFSGLRWKNWTLGAFLGESFSRHRPAFFLQSPGEILGLAYSRETEMYFMSLSLRKFRFSKEKNSMEFSAVSEAIGKKEKYIGYLNTILFFPSEAINWENSFYRQEKDFLLFATSPDRFTENASTKVFYSKLSHFFYDRLEYLQSISPIKKETIFGGNVSILPTKWGAICTGARLYKNWDIEQETSMSTSAGSLSYELKKKSAEILFRVEERKNKDRLYEIKWTYRPVFDWRLEFSGLFQKENNQFQSLYEQWSDGENVNTILTNRISALKFKLIGKMVSFNLSGSRNRQGNEIYYANIQLQWEF